MKQHKKKIEWQETTFEELSAQQKQVVQAAIASRNQAYAPYSKYLVGAAVLDLAGHIHSGANVEMVTYTGTTHAEQNAICAMALCSDIPKDKRRFTTLVCVAKNGGIPCELCQQAILEFCADKNAEIIGIHPNTRKATITTVKSLCPLSTFDRSADLS